MASKLDQLRIDHLLKPWLSKKSSHYKFLSNTVVQAILVNAAQKGLDTSTISNQLSKFSDDSKKVGHFVKKFNKKITKFQQKDLSSIMKIDIKPEFKPKDGSKKPFDRNSKQRPPFQKFYDQHKKNDIFQKKTINTEPQPKPITQEESKPQPQLPAYFVDSDQLSLRHSDQKIKPLLFNENGQRIDEEGNIIKTEVVHRQTFVSKLPQKEKQIIDRRIPTVAKPQTREFKFFDPGAISMEIEEKRKEAQIDLSVAYGYDIFDTIALSRNVEKCEIDWWDQPFVSIDAETGEWSPNYDTVDDTFENATLIPSPSLKERQVPTFSTEKERKRLRHINKIERQKEQRLMERLKLVPRAPEKIKANQLINFNQGQAVLAPTEVEMQAKAAQEYRKQKHEEANEKAKLAPEQRKQKKEGKRREDFDNNNINITVFIVDESINNPLNASKINSMANNWFMKGGTFLIKQPPMNFIVIQGGPKGTRKFIKLIQDRIKWDHWQGKVVFQGMAAGKTNFFNFKKYLFNITTECRRFMAKYQAEEFFDAASREYPSTEGNGEETSTVENIENRENRES